MSKPRFAIIIDSGKVQSWQLRVLRQNLDLIDIVQILNCTNTQTNRSIVRRSFYYLLNLLSIRRGLAKTQAFDFENVSRVSFESVRQGDWQYIPSEIIAIIKDSGAEGILKFGMGLLGDSDQLGLKYGVLSFHHGNPEKYRGRPAGFYELLENEGEIGVVLQKITNTLDGGEVLARALVKISHYSYYKTLQNAYSVSAEVFRHGLQNALDGIFVDIQEQGKVYFLPSNWMVVVFCIQLLKNKLQRLVYGAFFFKKWNLSKTKVDLLAFISEGELRGVNQLLIGQTAKIPNSYSGYADPFVDHRSEKIYVEGIKKRTNIGQILVLDFVDLDSVVVVTGAYEGHTSYPYIIRDNGDLYLMPEVASWSSPLITGISNNEKSVSQLIKGLECYRLVDATHFVWRDIHYIFAGHKDSSADLLYLFYSDQLLGPYETHPCNPIVMDVSCARMGGPVLVHGDRLFRFGQNNSRDYGDGLVCSEITVISPFEYTERKIFQVKVHGAAAGPHTINFASEWAIFDFYEERFSPLAGVRRAMNILMKHS